MNWTESGVKSCRTLSLDLEQVNSGANVSLIAHCCRIDWNFFRVSSITFALIKAKICTLPHTYKFVLFIVTLINLGYLCLANNKNLFYADFNDGLW